MTAMILIAGPKGTSSFNLNLNFLKMVAIKRIAPATKKEPYPKISVFKGLNQLLLSLLVGAGLYSLIYFGAKAYYKKEAFGMGDILYLAALSSERSSSQLNSLVKNVTAMRPSQKTSRTESEMY